MMANWWMPAFLVGLACFLAGWHLHAAFTRWHAATPGATGPGRSAVEQAVDVVAAYEREQAL